MHLKFTYAYSLEIYHEYQEVQFDRDLSLIKKKKIQNRIPI